MVVSNHNPEPKMENASELIKTIKKEEASVGVFLMEMEIGF